MGGSKRACVGCRAGARAELGRGVGGRWVWGEAGGRVGGVCRVKKAVKNEGFRV